MAYRLCLPSCNVNIKAQRLLNKKRENDGRRVRRISRSDGPVRRANERERARRLAGELPGSCGACQQGLDRACRGDEKRVLASLKGEVKEETVGRVAWGQYPIGRDQMRLSKVSWQNATKRRTSVREGQREDIVLVGDTG
jgi:hypothetical protein